MADCMQEWPEPIVRVQALAESGLSVIPRCYIKPPCDRPVVAPAPAVVKETKETSDISIPVVDLGELLLAEDGGAVGSVFGLGNDLTEAVAAACREWGFFQVVNHGVRPELMRAAREAWRGFFRRPLAEKQRYANLPRTYEGYGSRLGVQKGAVLDWGDYFFLHLAPEAAKSQAKFWPANPRNCKEVSEEYGREVVRLCELLMRVLSASLGLDEAHFQRAFGGADCGATLRANYYPRCPQPNLTLGLSAHSDPGALTVLLADEHVRGLTTGNWLFADCNFLCQLFFFDTRQRGPFADWNFLQSAKQHLPTAFLCRLPGSWQSHGFADCQAVGKELQSAKEGHG